MSRTSLDTLASRLSSVSVRSRADPYTRFEWSATADRDRPVMSEGLLSLAGHARLDTLAAEQRWRLGLAEMAHFFSLNIAGERELMTGLARRLEHGTSAAVAGYLHHFLDEENAHMVVFVEFCRRYAGKIYPERQLRLTREFLPGEEDFLFFAQTLIFEEISAWFNRKLASDPALWPLVRDINDYHATEEARHLSFGRGVVEDLWTTSAPGWGEDGRQRIGSYLRAYVRTTLRSYVEPAVYIDAGLGGDVLALRNEVLASPTRQALEAAATRRLGTILDGLGVAK